MLTIDAGHKLFNHLQILENDVVLDVKFSKDLPNQLRMIELSKRDLAIAKLVQPYIKEHIETIVSNYYTEIQKEHSLLKIISDNSSVERLKTTLKRHLCELFEGKIDQSFVNQRIRIAQVHVQIGLKTKWYMGAFQSLFSTFVEILQRYISDKEELFESILVVSKLLNLEQQLVLEAYEEEVERIKQEEQAKKQIRERVTQNVDSLSAIAEQTHVSVNVLMDKTDTLMKLVTSSVQTAENVQEQLSQEKQVIVDQQKQMNHIKEASSTITEQMHHLQKIATEIDDIIQLVQGLAKQTRLISFNTSIESQRRGDNVFKSIAEQVKKLSETTHSSVSNITELIKRTHTEINKVSVQTEQVKELVEKGFSNMENISRFFTMFLETAESSKQNNISIKTELDLYMAHFKEINLAIGYLADTTRGISLIAQEI